METTDQPCRDVHGMEVSRDHKELLDMYSPVWEQEELARCDSWQQFLTRAAGALVELGLLPAGRTEPSQQSVILQALLVNRQRLNPQLVKELEQLVSSGIPRPLRGVAWQQLLGGPQAFPEGYYESLLFSMQEHCPIVSPLQLVSPSLVPPVPRCPIPADKLEAWSKSARTWLLQISKDTLRTFPGHDRMAGEGAAALGRVLAAFTLHAPDMGYCQGMNFVAGALLLVGCGGEAGAFAALVGVASHLLPGYYAPVMVAPQVDQAVFRELVVQHFPALSAHLEAGLGCEVGAPLPGWLLSGWVNWLPFEAAARLWDVAAWEGSGAVFMRAALALLHLYGGALGGASDALDASVLLHAMPGMTYDAERLLGVAQGCYSEISPAVLQSLQDIARINMAAASQLAEAAAEGGGGGAGPGSAAAPPPPSSAAAAAAAGLATGPQVETMPTAQQAGDTGVATASDRLGAAPSTQGAGSGIEDGGLAGGAGAGMVGVEGSCSSGDSCQGGALEPSASGAAPAPQAAAAAGAEAIGGAAAAAAAAAHLPGQAGPAAEGCEVDNGWVPDFATPVMDPSAAPLAAVTGAASYSTLPGSSSSSSSNVQQLVGQQQQKQGQAMPQTSANSSSSYSSNTRGDTLYGQANHQPPGSHPTHPVASPGDEEDEEGDDECSGLLLPSDSSGSNSRQRGGSGGGGKGRAGGGGLGALAATWRRQGSSSSGGGPGTHSDPRQQQKQQQQRQGSGETGGGGIARERYKVYNKGGRSKAVAEAYAIALTPGLIPHSRGPSAAGAGAAPHPAAAAQHTPGTAHAATNLQQQGGVCGAAASMEVSGSSGSGSGSIGAVSLTGTGVTRPGGTGDQLRVRASEDEWVDLGCLGAGAGSPAALAAPPGAAAGAAGGSGPMYQQQAAAAAAAAVGGASVMAHTGGHAHAPHQHHHHHPHQQQQQEEGGDAQQGRGEVHPPQPLPSTTAPPAHQDAAWPADLEQRYGLDAMRDAWAAAAAAAAALDAGDPGTGDTPGDVQCLNSARGVGPVGGASSSTGSLLTAAAQGVGREQRRSLDAAAAAPTVASGAAAAAANGSTDGSWGVATPAAAAAAAGSGDGSITPALPSGLSTPGGMSRTASVAIAAAREAATWLSQELLAGPSPRQQQQEQEAGQQQQQQQQQQEEEEADLPSISQPTSDDVAGGATATTSASGSSRTSGGVLTLKQHARANLGPAAAAAAVRGSGSPLGSPRTRLGSSSGQTAGALWSSNSGLASPSGTGSARGGSVCGAGGGYSAVLSQLLGAVTALESEVVAAAAAQAASSARAREVLRQYEAVVGAAWDKVGVLLTALAAREGEVGALQQQLMQESRRLEQQDEELAAKDELIAALHARLSVALPASHHHNHHAHHQHHQHQQQQQARSRGPSFAGGSGGGGTGVASLWSGGPGAASAAAGGAGSPPGGGSNSGHGEPAASGLGKSFTAAFAARFSSPTKAPQQQQQQEVEGEGSPGAAGAAGLAAGGGQEGAAAAAAPTWRQRLLPLRKPREAAAAGGGPGAVQEQFEASEG